MAEPIRLSVWLEHSEPWVEWCDRCLLSHAFIDIWSLTDRGVGGIGRWGDHTDNEET